MSHNDGVPQLALPPARREASSNSLDRSDDPSTFSHSSSFTQPYQPYPNDAYSDEADAPILPPQFSSAPHSSTSSPEPVYMKPGQTENRGHGRGVSLVDTGPVGMAQVAHEPVRRVSRQQKRQSSSRNLVSPTSSNSHSALPPGAVSCAAVDHGHS
jgi:chitin synthase